MRTGALTAFLLLVFAVSGPLFAQQPTAAEAPLTNADVVKLIGLGLGDNVVIAKVNQAASVNFDLSADGLTKLKSSRVSSDVIAAMLKRATPAAQPNLPPEVAARINAAKAHGAFGRNVDIA